MQTLIPGAQKTFGPFQIFGYVYTGLLRLNHTDVYLDTPLEGTKLFESLYPLKRGHR